MKKVATIILTMAVAFSSSILVYAGSGENPLPISPTNIEIPFSSIEK